MCIEQNLDRKKSGKHGNLGTSDKIWDSPEG
jgi:hypothetical protein